MWDPAISIKFLVMDNHNKYSEQISALIAENVHMFRGFLILN